MHRILILSSAAIALSACSMHSDSMYGDNSYSNAYSQNNCGVPQCAPGSTYAVSNSAAQYEQEAHYGGQYGDMGYGAPQQPAAHAYGSQVQTHVAHGGHHGYGHGQAPQLRGAYGPNTQRSYKYGTLGVVAYDVDSDIYGIQGRLGYQSAQFIGAEVEGSFGVIDDKETVGATELKAGVDYSVAAFGRAVIPLGERFNVFARGGYHATGIRGSATDATGTVKVTDSTDGFAYGAGAEWAVNPRDSIRLDYTRYDVGPGETDSVSLAYARKF
ncbi:MAG: outer membrane beta-barrel protein [Hellea sp.]